MTPAAIIQRVREEGVTLALTLSGTIKASGDGAKVNRWLPVIRGNKSGIVAALQETANDRATHYCWSIAFPNLPAITVAITQEATHAEVAAIYPGARVEPLPDPTRRKTTLAEADELRELVVLILADADEGERVEALNVALADPEAALMSFRVLAAELKPGPLPDPDDRRTCAE